MISKILADLLQDLLKDFFPKFAYWLFYSEMTVALLLGILSCFAWPIGAIIFFVYAAFCWVGACNYGRKRAAEKKLPWEPSHFDRSMAIFMNAGLIVMGAGFAVIAFDSNWLGAILGVALILLSGFNIIGLISGKWVTFP